MWIASAAAPLVEASVTGFTSTMAAVVIYLGSTLWFILLLAFDARELAMDASSDIHIMTMSANVILFLLQTINVLRFMFRFWPVVALYYTAQFWVLGLRAALVALHPGRLVLYSLTLLAQCLFTSSQMAVTLEYLHRRSPSVVPPSLSTAIRPVAGLGWSSGGI